MNMIPYTAEHGIFRDSLRKFLDKEIVPHLPRKSKSAHICPAVCQATSLRRSP